MVRPTLLFSDTPQPNSENFAHIHSLLRQGKRAPLWVHATAQFVSPSLKSLPFTSFPDVLLLSCLSLDLAPQILSLVASSLSFIVCFVAGYDAAAIMLAMTVPACGVVASLVLMAAQATSGGNPHYYTFAVPVSLPPFL